MEWIKRNKIQAIAIAVVLFISVLSHGYNMFHYPYYENDEGVYMSQAWSLIKEGKLAPYTYWYDHAPAGWIVIAIWTLLTGGFFTFGMVVNSGRMLMLLIHLAISAQIIYISSRYNRSIIPGLIAVLLFSLSPLGIYFQRRVLLDNLMMLWVIVGLSLLVVNKFRLRHSILSGIALGIAVLTKEYAVFFVPAFLYVIYIRAQKKHRFLAIVKWLAVFSAVVSIYFLYALLKNELMPAPIVDGLPTHVSLITTFGQQLSRGSSSPFWQEHSDFYNAARDWYTKDSFLFIVGSLSLGIGILLAPLIKSLRLPLLMTCFYLLFLMRGKLVLDFYVIPIIPLVSWLAGSLIYVPLAYINRQKSTKLFGYALSGVIIGLLGWGAYSGNKFQYTRDETTPQIRMVEWVRENLPPDAYIVIDNYSYVDLHDKRRPTDPVFPNADWFQKLNLDTDIAQGKLHNDWKTIEYIALSHEMVRQSSIRPTDFVFLRHALENSYPIIDWKQGATAFVDVPKYISTNGDWAAVHKVLDQDEIVLDTSWQYYKKTYIHSYGQVIDPQTDSTTSEGQSYAMLRSVLVEDKQTFDGVWAWTKDHMQYRGGDKLFSWRWKGNKITDTASAADADIDIATALILASEVFDDWEYRKAAYEIIRDIWAYDVVKIRGSYYLTSGTSSKNDQGYLVNPSYFSPAAFELFETIYPEGDWEALTDDMYALIGKYYFPPNWLLVNEQGVFSAKDVIDDADDYGFDAFRTFFRIALHREWNDDFQAKAYLNARKSFFENEWNLSHKFAAVYSQDGDPVTDYTNISTAMGPLSIFKDDVDKNKELVQALLIDTYNDEGYWGDQDNYYNQNWAWMGYALLTGNLNPDLPRMPR